VRLYHRYLLGPLVFFLPLFLLTLSGIYLLVEFFERLEDLLSAGAHLRLLFLYLLYRFPEILFQVWPAVAALAALASLAFLSRGNELLALRSLGFSPWRLVKPYLAALLLLSFAVSGLLALTLPEGTYRALYTWEVRVKRAKPATLLASGRFFFSGPDFLLWARPLEPKGEWLADLLLIRKEKNRPVAYLYARRARFLRGKKWRLEEGLLAKAPGDFAPERFRSRTLDLGFSPEVLLSVRRPLKALSLRELISRYRFLRASGLSPAAPLTEILYRLSYPFLGPLLAAPALFVFLIFRGKRALARGLSAGLLLIALLYGLFVLLRVLSAGGHLPVWLAFPLLWTFPVASVILFLKKSY